MPASLAHFFVCDGAAAVAAMTRSMDGVCLQCLKKYPSYARLGSIGPDLPYYATPVRSGIYMVLDFELPISPHGHLLHCKTPSLFAGNLISIAAKDLRGSGKDAKRTSMEQTLAFALGYLTHIAADITVHPSVNSVAGEFYASKTNQVCHREAEIYQDVLLFIELYGGDREKARDEFMKKNFAGWIDPLQDSPIAHLVGGWDTHYYFRGAIQRAFIETYGTCPTEKEIEEWVDGTILAMEKTNHTLSPYTRVFHRMDEGKAERYFHKTGYFRRDDPVVRAALELWNEDGKLRRNMRGLANRGKQRSLFGRAMARSLEYMKKANSIVNGTCQPPGMKRFIGAETLM